MMRAFTSDNDIVCVCSTAMALRQNTACPKSALSDGTNTKTTLQVTFNDADTEVHKVRESAQYMFYAVNDGRK